MTETNLTNSDLLAYFDELDEIEEEEFKAERRQLRLQHCGNVIAKIDAHNGTYGYYKSECGLYQLCDRCRAKRAMKMKNEIERALIDNDDVRQVECDDEESDDLVKRYGKKNVRRFPQSGGKNTVFVSTEEEVGEEVTDDSLDNIDWEEIVQTPEKRNVSGTLGKLPAPVEDEKKTETIEVVDYIFSSDSSEDTISAILDAGKQAEEATGHLDPKTAEEVSDAIVDRSKVFIDFMEDMGFKVAGKLKHKVKVEISRICWRS